ncbi:hypothetical protein CEXT_204593 [Caerostris extrusa]|uniref:Uncharacterized protein n=1 Tax=Caerostris extrusa TaxID=172846 RepID=A0AAV4MSY4_CAEEX|nr:hypothetical protein CEXT_204593 [Caerostris extrusa]
MAKIGKRSTILQAAMFVAIFSMHELSNPDNSNYQQRPYSDYLRYYSSKGNSYDYEDPVIDYLRYYISKGDPYNSDNQQDLDPNYIKYYSFNDPSLFKSNQIHYRVSGQDEQCVVVSPGEKSFLELLKAKLWDYETGETVAERASSGIKGGDYYMQTVGPYLYRLPKPRHHETYKSVTLPYQIYDNRKISMRNARKGYYLSDAHKKLLPWEGMSNSEEEEALKNEVIYKNVTLPDQIYDNKKKTARAMQEKLHLLKRGS